MDLYIHLVNAVGFTAGGYSAVYAPNAVPADRAHACASYIVLWKRLAEC